MKYTSDMKELPNMTPNGQGRSTNTWEIEPDEEITQLVIKYRQQPKIKFDVLEWSLTSRD